ncbi:MAG: sugar phosphate nucleotidyltransferase [Candidatus Baldrarchaeia archaeon]
MKRIKIGVVPATGRDSRISELPLTRIVRYKKELVQEYFKNGEDWDIDIQYIGQKGLKGNVHTIGLTEYYINEPFIVIRGDDLMVANSLDNLINLFWKNKAFVAEGVMIEKDIEVLRRTCCVTLNNNYKIVEIEEKPLWPKSNMCGIGIYLFDPVVFIVKYIKKMPKSPKRREKEITDIMGLVAKDCMAYEALINGININVKHSGRFDICC